MRDNKTYIAIDLKSFFASVECVERNLNPLKTNLVVADVSKTEKTICLAVSPSLKSYGISGRARLFEVVQSVNIANNLRRKKAPKKELVGKSYDDDELKSNPSLAIDYIAASPRMALYMEYSTRIYNVYLKYVAPEDIHVYSIDEVFIDATVYLKIYGKDAYSFTRMLIKDVLAETGITATAGIGTNLYLCKVAMDIVAKRVDADEDGVRIACLDEITYRKELWNHKPITDFWRVGKGYAEKLEQKGIYTMGDVARCSLGRYPDYYNEDMLYDLFGINAELLVDHAWGWEPCTLSAIKAYRPLTNSISNGQVLSEPYDFEKTRLVIMEMLDILTLELVDKGLVTDQIVLTIGYDVNNEAYTGPIVKDFYGRKIPKHAHGSANLGEHTSSTKLITEAAVALFDRIVDKSLLCRRMSVTANHVVEEATLLKSSNPVQLNFIEECELSDEQRAEKQKNLKKEKSMQKTVLNIKKKYGKNSILKGMNFKEGATAKERNKQIGGHKA